MKRIILLTTIISLFSISSLARPTGLNLGGGLSFLGSTASYKTAPANYFGPYWEIGYDLKLAENSYIYFGGRFNYGIHMWPEIVEYDSAKTTIGNIGSLFFPIRYQHNFDIGHRNKLYLEAGPAAGVLLYNFNINLDVEPESVSPRFENLINSGEPRANVYLGGNFGIKIKNHVKIYLGGDYGCVPFKSTNDKINRWQINFGACYVF